MTKNSTALKKFLQKKPSKVFLEGLLH